MKTLDRMMRWIRMRTKTLCHFCGEEVREIDRYVLFEQIMGVAVCGRCFDQPMARYALDRIWWSKIPEDVPPCRHCGKGVAPEDLVPEVRENWYFCTACASDSAILRQWEHISNDMEEGPIPFTIKVTDL